MAMKLLLVLLAAVAIVSANEKVKRQSNGPDFNQFNEYFNQFQEQLKPITGNFPSLPNGFGSFPTIPGMGGSTTSGSSPSKRQISQESMTEFFNKLQENANFANFKPDMFKPGFFPIPGSSSSGSSENNGNRRY